MPTNEDRSDLVAQSKADLVSAGGSLDGASGAWAITNRVAWALRTAGWGLVAKRPEQHGYDVNGLRYGVDVIMHARGDAVDILIDAGGTNIPTWQPLAERLPPGLWRAPIRPAEILPRPNPGPLPGPPPPPDVLAVLTTLDLRLREIRADVAMILDLVRAIERRVPPPYRGRVLGWPISLHPDTKT